MAGTTAATLEEARDPARWGRACNVVLAHLAPVYGPKRALALLGQAADRSAPPDGKDPWDYASGAALEDHLLRVVENCRNQERRDPNVTRRVGSSEVVDQVGTAPSLSPEERAAHRDMLRKVVDEVRAKLHGKDPEALALFEWSLRPGTETLAALPTDKGLRDLANSRLRNLVASVRGRLEGPSKDREALS